MNRSGGVSVDQVLRMARPMTQVASPLSGSTVEVQSTDGNLHLWLTPVGTLLSLNVTLPTGWIGQRVSILTGQAITALTVNGAATILGALSTLAVGGSFEMTKVDANTWV